MSRSTDHLRGEAQSASQGLDALVLAAERLSAALSFGNHGLRRAGSGEEFWQYRPASDSDTTRAIDWRRSARTDTQYVRDREAQVAQSAVLWLSRGLGMDYAGGPDRPSKAARGAVLSLALGMALLRGGERVGLLGEPPKSGRVQSDALARGLIAPPPEPAGDDDHPPLAALRPGQQVVLISDFLGEEQPVLDFLDRAAAMGLRGVMLQILDPDEESFPFSGAVLFRSASGKSRHDTRDAGGLREAYLARLADRRAMLTRAAQQSGWHFGTHDTASPPATALMWLAAALEG